MLALSECSPPVTEYRDHPPRGSVPAWERPGAGTGRPAEALDATDVQLLRLLQDDGRLSIARLADAVGLAPATVHERLARLKRDDVILGYEAVLNPAKLGSALLVFAEIRMSGSAPGIALALKAAVNACDEVVECHQLSGSFDYLIKVRVPDMQAYRRLVAEVLWKLPGVHEVRAYAVIDEVKNSAGIPL